MSDRLAELVRQRTLVQEHLAWLDREIAQLAQKTSAIEPPATPAVAPFPDPVASRTNAPAAPPAPVTARTITVSGTSEPADPDEILKKFRATPGSVQSEVRKGCFLYFAAAFVLLGIGLALLYFLVSSRPH